jgi:hypothetical protein
MMQKLGRRILQNPDYLLKNPSTGKETRRQRIGEVSKNTREVIDVFGRSLTRHGSPVPARGSSGLHGLAASR